MCQWLLTSNTDGEMSWIVAGQMNWNMMRHDSTICKAKQNEIRHSAMAMVRVHENSHHLRR